MRHKTLMRLDISEGMITVFLNRTGYVEFFGGVTSKDPGQALNQCIEITEPFRAFSACTITTRAAGLPRGIERCEFLSRIFPSAPKWE